MSYYVTVMLMYVLIGVISAWGLNLQFGETGVLNFAFIVFVAAGAYTTGVLSLGHPGHGGYQQYFWGAAWPWPLPWIASTVVGGLLGLAVGAISLRRLRGDYQAMVMLVVSLIATYLVSANVGFLNGQVGLALIPAPFQGSLHLSTLGYRWFYLGLTAAFTLLVYEVMRRITNSPLGRRLRAVRENEAAAVALGTNVVATRLLTMFVGGAVAALAGAIEVQFVGAWAPSGWTYPETFGLFAAVLVGGRGNLGGVAVGALLVQGLFLEGTVLLPNIGSPDLIGAVQWITMGVMIMVFMWFRPQGVIPERRKVFDGGGAATRARRFRLPLVPSKVGGGARG
ncbi:MAG TPA: branched-chain amino acid ABC transporter permease [Acidimicrobiales bacterium]|nr:branched-chain amino acid ABC transporter permease [Acidimicrobiales bacterium]